MFNNARRKLSGWGAALMAGLGLSLAPPSAATGSSYSSYRRMRDDLPQEVQDDRIKRAIATRLRKNVSRAVNHARGVRNYAPLSSMARIKASHSTSDSLAGWDV